MTYNGAREPLTQSQGLAYVRQLVSRGWRMSIVSFERRSGDRAADASETAVLAAQLTAEQINWSWRWYHKRPPILSTVWDIARGAWVTWRAACRMRADVLHARGTIPALMVYPAARLVGKPWLLDLRGLLAEEYADGGLWPRGSWRHRMARQVERWLIRRADGIVVLTHRIAKDLPAYAGSTHLAPVLVIPCCVDLGRFPWPPCRPMDVGGARRAPTLAYVGSLGTWYLLDEMLEFFKALQGRIREAKFLIVSPSLRQDELTRALARAEVDARSVEIRTVLPGQVSGVLAQADCGIALIQPSYAKAASSPTKIAEYLAAGLPIVVNRGVGDLSEFVVQTGVGVVVDELAPDAYAQAADRLALLLSDPDGVAQRCRRTAETFLSLAVAGERYGEMYNILLERSN